MYPIVQPVTFDSDGNVELDTSAPALFTGHLTTWFGDEDNQRNEVQHATVTFQGTSPSGQAVSLHAHIQYGTNAHGDTTVVNEDAAC